MWLGEYSITYSRLRQRLHANTIIPRHIELLPLKFSILSIPLDSSKKEVQLLDALLSIVGNLHQLDVTKGSTCEAESVSSLDNPN
jgi:hypothetical protein